MAKNRIKLHISFRKTYSLGNTISIESMIGNRNKAAEAANDCNYIIVTKEFIDEDRPNEVEAEYRRDLSGGASARAFHNSFGELVVLLDGWQASYDRGVSWHVAETVLLDIERQRLLEI